jgi:predicted ABC-type ATPase
VRPQLWVVAGPNGAGKSTLVRRYGKVRLLIVNPDEIARRIAPDDFNARQVQIQADARRSLSALICWAEGHVFWLRRR